MDEVVANLAMSPPTSISPGEEEPPSKMPATEPTSTLPLPDELVVNCLARVSRLHHPILSLVSKSFRSVITSPELYETRSLLHRTERCLYVCLRFPPEPNPRWFTLFWKPDKTLNNHITKQKKKKKKTNKKEGSSSGNVLAPIQILNSPSMKWSNLVAIGHKLYAISGGATEDGDGTCSNVFFLDCRTHSWIEAASLRLAPKTNCEFDGKMYVAGTSEKPVPLKSVEVYNARTQTWNPASPEKRMFKSRIVKGMIYMNSDAVGFDMNVRGGVCLIENIIYSYSKSSEEFHWAVDMLDVWRKVEGLEGALPKFAGYSTVRLADFGGKMMAFWDKYVPSSGYKEKVIWCAVISLEKRSSEEIWGKVEWFDAVLTVPKTYKFVYAIAATF